MAEINVSDTAGAGVIVFKELQTGISLGQGMGILIDSIEYRVDVTALQLMDDDGDYFIGAVTVSDSVTTLGGSGKKQIIHQMQYVRTDGGTAATSNYHKMPWRYDFFPPIIVASPRIYGAFANNLGASTQDLFIRVYFRYIELSTKDYLEIAESFVLVG